VDGSNSIFSSARKRGEKPKKKKREDDEKREIIMEKGGKITFPSPCETGKKSGQVL